MEGAMKDEQERRGRDAGFVTMKKLDGAEDIVELDLLEVLAASA